jgi:hypothetical protein
MEFLIVEVLALLAAWRSLDRVVHAQLCVSTLVSSRNAPANTMSLVVRGVVLLKTERERDIGTSQTLNP